MLIFFSQPPTLQTTSPTSKQLKKNVNTQHPTMQPDFCFKNLLTSNHLFSGLKISSTNARGGGVVGAYQLTPPTKLPTRSVGESGVLGLVSYAVAMPVPWQDGSRADRYKWSDMGPSPYKWPKINE